MVEKEKTKKAVRRHFSAGGAVYRNFLNPEWLIIRPRDTDKWQLPKGTIDSGEKSDKTAVREVFEETGVRAKILKKITSVRYFFVRDGERVFKTVVFYLMKSRGEEPKIEPEWAHEVEEVMWVTTETALNMLSYRDERKIIEKSLEILEEKRNFDAGKVGRVAKGDGFENR